MSWVDFNPFSKDQMIIYTWWSICLIWAVLAHESSMITIDIVNYDEKYFKWLSEVVNDEVWRLE